MEHEWDGLSRNISSWIVFNIYFTIFCCAKRWLGAQLSIRKFTPRVAKCPFHRMDQAVFVFLFIINLGITQRIGMDPLRIGCQTNKQTDY
jgi:hypothetical protein